MWASREGEKLKMAPARPAEVTKGVGRGCAGGAASMQKECTRQNFISINKNQDLQNISKNVGSSVHMRRGRGLVIFPHNKALTFFVRILMLHLDTHLLALVCPLHRHFPCHASISHPHPSLLGLTTSSSPLLHNHHTPVALVLRRVLHSPWIKPLSDVCLPLHFGVVLPTCRRKSHCTAFYILSYPHALRISCN